MSSMRWTHTGSWILAFMAASLLACSGSEDGSGFPEVAGWTQESEALVYDANNLWEYINGAAELFVAYDVQSCQTADLSSGDRTVTVDLYDMGTPLNAFGVFAQEASGETVDVPGATVAMVSPPYQALLLKGSTYAKVNAFQGELTLDSGRELLESLAASLPGEAALPTELDLLPPEGKRAGTEGYVAESFLGLEGLSHCVLAEYAGAEGESWTGFVVLPEAAAGVWEGLAETWDSVSMGEDEVLYREVPYQGFVGVVQMDEGLMGVAGVEDLDRLLARLEAFLQ